MAAKRLLLATGANLIEMILEFTVWGAVPGQASRRRSDLLRVGCYAVEMNLQTRSAFVFRHQNCVRAMVGRDFTPELARRGVEPARKHARYHPRLYLRKPVVGSDKSIDAKAAWTCGD